MKVATDKIKEPNKPESDLNSEPRNTEKIEDIRQDVANPQTLASTKLAEISEDLHSEAGRNHDDQEAKDTSPDLPDSIKKIISKTNKTPAEKAMM